MKKNTKANPKKPRKKKANIDLTYARTGLLLHMMISDQPVTFKDFFQDKYKKEPDMICNAIARL